MDAESGDLPEEQVPPVESQHVPPSCAAPVDAAEGFTETPVTDEAQAKLEKKMWEGLTFLMVSSLVL
jgi:hypothetical protein